MTTHYQTDTASVAMPDMLPAAETQDKFSVQSIIFDAKMYEALDRMAHLMASSKCTIPAHLQNKPSDCFAILMQAMRWNMDPYAVAQKTFVVQQSGILSYESQLIISVINTRAPLAERLNYEWFGPWDQVIGKFKTETSKSGNTWQKAGWSKQDEQGCGVRVYARLKDEEEPRVLELLLSQATVRNSTLWASDPKQQLAYLAAKRWARLHAPEVVLGLYSPDELEDRNAFKDITPLSEDAPRASVKGTSKLKQKLQARHTSGTVIDAQAHEAGEVQPKNPIGQLLLEIENAQDAQVLDQIAAKVRDLELASGSQEHHQLISAWRDRQAFLELMAAIDMVNLDNLEQIREHLNSKLSVMTQTSFAYLQDLLEERAQILSGGQPA